MWVCGCVPIVECKQCGCVVVCQLWSECSSSANYSEISPIQHSMGLEDNMVTVPYKMV